MSEIPDFQLHSLAAAAGVLMDEFDIELEEAVQVAARIQGAVKEALAEFGPELTLAAAEVLWRGEEES